MTHEPHDIDGLLRQFVQGRDVCCPSCGYNLRNTSSERCSECGWRLEIQLASPRGKSGAWILVLLCSAVPLGFYLTAPGIACYAIAQRDDRMLGDKPGTISPFDLKLILVISSACVVLLLAMYVTTRLRERIARLSGLKRWFIGLLCASALVTGHYFTVRWILELV